jgi:hypothetical protein
MDQSATARRIVKYLAVCQDPAAFRQVLRSAPDRAIKVICNASLNAIEGDVTLTDEERNLLRKYRDSVLYLIAKDKSIARKRALLLSKKKQVGGYYFLPTLLNAVLKSLGRSLFAS